MAATILHSRTITISDGAHSDYLQPSNWNAGHVIYGVVEAVNSIAPDGSGNVYHSHQPGVESEPVITDNGDGTIKIATCNAWFFTDASRDTLVYKTIAGGTILSIPVSDTTIVAANRDTSDWALFQDVTQIDYLQYVPYLVVYRGASTNMHFQKVTLDAHSELSLNHERLMNCGRYDRESGMDQISVAPTTNLLTVNAGVMWTSNRRYQIAAVTSANSKWFFNYHVASVWTSAFHANNAAINNTQYDNGTGLVSLDVGEWVINYIYRGIEDQDHVYTLLSDRFPSVEEAKAYGSIGVLPELITSHAVLIGRVIVMCNTDVAAANIESAFDHSWSATTPVTNHEDLTGLVGGDAAGHYHINSYQYGAVSQIVATGASNSYLAQNGTYYSVGGGGAGTGFTGTNATGTLNSNGLAISVAAQTGNFLSSNASSAFAGTGFTGTNITGTLGTGGLSVQVAAQTGNFLTSNASSAFAGTGFTGTNATGTLGTGGLSLNVGAQTASLANTANVPLLASINTGSTSGAMVAVATAAGALTIYGGNSTSFGKQSATPSQNTGASSVLANNGAWVTVVTAQSGNFLTSNASTAFAGTGFTGTNCSGTMGTNGLSLNVAVGTATGGGSVTNYSGIDATTGANGTSIALSSNYQAASVVMSTGASNSFLAGNGTYYSVQAGGGNYLSTNASTAFAINSFFAGTNISATLNSSTWQMSVAAPIASGNSTSFGYQSATPSQTTGATSVLANNGAWVTVMTAGNYVSTNATTAYAQAASVSGTNVSITHNASGLSISGAVGTGFSGSGVSGTVNATGLALSVATGYVSTNATTAYAQAATVTGTNAWITHNASGLSISAAVGTGVTATNATGTLGTGGLSLNVAQFVGSINGSTTNNWALDINNGLAETVSASGMTLGLSSNYTAASNVVASGASNSFLAGNGTYYSIAGGNVTNNYSGGVIGAINTAGSTVASAGTFYISGQNGLTAGMTTGTVSSGSHSMYVGLQPISHYDWPPAWWQVATSASVALSTNIIIKPFQVLYPVVISKVLWPVVMSAASTAGSTNAHILNTVVIYTLNGSTLTPIIGAAGTLSNSYSTTSTAYVNGVRMCSIALATTLTPGDYWFGLQNITSQANFTLSNVIMSAGSAVQPVIIPWGSSVIATNNVTQFQGVIAASMSATNNTWNINQVNATAASWYKANIPLSLENITY